MTTPESMMPGQIEMMRDPVDEAIDEIADLCEYWKRSRGNGRTPITIRMALLMAMRQVVEMGAKKTPVAGNQLLAVRTANCLLAAGIEYIENAQKMSDGDLLKIPNFGRRCLSEVRAWKND